MPWSALNGQPLVSLAPDNATQQFVEEHLARAGVACPHSVVVNLLDTQIAMVEANEGMAIVPSFGLIVAPTRRVAVTRLFDPVAHLDFHQISTRSKPLAPDAVAFSAFLQGYLSRWADRSGVL
jgi:DNA-binding transcriptional LysR family regulator